MQNTSPAARQWFWFAMKLVVSMTLLVWLFQRFNLSAASLKPISYYPLFIALAATCAIIFAAAVRWQVILTMYAQRLPFRETFHIQYVAAFMTQFLPGLVGGDAVRIYMATRRGVRLVTGLASVMLDRGVAMLGLIVVVAAVSPRALEVVTDVRLMIMLLVIAAAACLGTVALVLLSGALDRMARRMRWLSPFALLASGLRDVFRSPRPLAAVLCASVCTFIMYAIGLWTSLAALGNDVPLWDVLAVFAPVILFQMLPVSIGGWGVREFMAVTMLAAIGVPGPQALAASIILGIVQTIASLPGSIAWFVHFNLQQPDLRGS